MDPTNSFLCYSAHKSCVSRIIPGILTLILILTNCAPICGAEKTAVDYYDLGESWYLEGDYNAAISAYLKATTLNPYYAEAWNNLGLAYGQGDQNIEAVSAFKWAVMINPEYSEAWNNLGDVYTKMGRYDDAREAYQKALSITTNNQKNQFPPPDRQWDHQPVGNNYQGMNNPPSGTPPVIFPSPGNKIPGQFPGR